MTEPLVEQLKQTRRRLKRVLAVYGLCWVVAGTIAVLAVVGLADWLVHASAGMRLLFLTLTGATFAFLLYRYFIKPLSVRISDLDLALRFEQLHPELGERLSSTLDFLKDRQEDKPVFGSKTLRQQVIKQAVELCSKMHITELIEMRPLRRVGFGALLVACVVGSLVIANPTNAALALRRLVNPFGDAQWPKQTQLRFVRVPDKVAKGDAFAVEVQALGVVPRQVTIRYRFEDEPQTSPDALRVTNEGNFRGGLDAVNRSFQFSVSGGDAQTPWRAVDVVPAPEIEALSVKVQFPGYTGLPDEEYPSGRGHVRAVVGSKVSLAARSNKSLTRAELQWDHGETIAAEVLEDGVSLRSSFQVKENDYYRIVMFDTQQMSNLYRSPKRFRVQAIPDRKPEVSLQEPVSDMDVTEKATVPLKALIKDDFGVNRVSLHYQVNKGGSVAGTSSEIKQTTLLEAKEQEILERCIAEHRWPLEPLKLGVGDVVQFHIAALDRRDDPGPNEGKSRIITLRIVNKGDFLDQVDNQQQLVREELQRVLKLQRGAEQQVSELKQKAEIVGKLEGQEIERLQAAEMVQRRIREKVADSGNSLQRQVSRLLEQMTDNNVSDVESTKRLQLIDSELARIAEQHLPPISQSLNEARKQAKFQSGEQTSKPPRSEGAEEKAGDSKGGPSKDGSPSDSKPDSKAEASKSDPDASPSKTGSEPSNIERAEKPPESGETKAGKQEEQTPSEELGNNPSRQLARANDHQQKVVSSLEQMLDQLNQWDSIFQVTNDARDLQKRQHQVQQQVGQVAQQTLGKSKDELNPEQRAEVAKAAGRQDDARRQLQRLQQKMDRLAQRADDEDPLNADLLKDSLEQLRQSNVNGKMSDAVNNIRQNRMGEAAKSQQQVARALKDLVDQLENRQEQELARLLKKLKEAEKDLDDITEQQRRLLRKSKEAQKLTDPKQREEELKRLQRRQEQLQQRAEEFAKRLSRLRAQAASRHSGRAGQRMGQAGRSMRQQNGQAQKQQEDALEELQRAQQELAKTRQETEEQLEQEQLAKIADALRQVYERESAIKQELLRLDGLRNEKGRLSRGEMQSVSALSRSQSGLAAEAKQMTQKISQAKVFVTVINQSVDKMNQAADLLKERHTGKPTQRAVDGALRRFAQLLESLKRDPPKGNKKQAQQQQQGGGGGGQGGGDGIPNIAQVKLLKLMQTELVEQTLALLEAKQQEQWSPEQQEELVQLSKQQGKLADLARELTQPQEDEGDLP